MKVSDFYNGERLQNDILIAPEIERVESVRNATRHLLEDDENEKAQEIKRIMQKELSASLERGERNTEAIASNIRRVLKEGPLKNAQLVFAVNINMSTEDGWPSAEIVYFENEKKEVVSTESLTGTVRADSASNFRVELGEDHEAIESEENVDPDLRKKIEEVVRMAIAKSINKTNPGLLSEKLLEILKGGVLSEAEEVLLPTVNFDPNRPIVEIIYYQSRDLDRGLRGKRKVEVEIDEGVFELMEKRWGRESMPKAA